MCSVAMTSNCVELRILSAVQGTECNFLCATDFAHLRCVQEIESHITIVVRQIRMLKTIVVLATFIIIRNCVTKNFYDFYHATLC